MDSNLKRETLQATLEQTISKAYSQLKLGDPGKKIRKLIARSSKKLSKEIMSLLKEEAKKKQKELKKVLKKEHKKEKNSSTRVGIAKSKTIVSI